MSTLLVKSAVAGGIKVCSAVIAFLLTVIVARILGAEQAGLFLLGFSVLSALSLFFRLGLDNVILRCMGSEGVGSEAQYNLNVGLLWVAIAVIPFSGLVLLMADVLAVSIFQKPEMAPVLVWMMLALPSMALFVLISMAFQGLYRIVLATLFQNLGLSALFVCLFSCLWFFGGVNLTAELAMMAYSSCAVVICALSLFIWFRQPGVNFRFEGGNSTELWAVSSSLWVVSCMSILVQWSGVLVASIYVQNDELAFFSAAQRTAMLISFVLMVVNFVVAPRYARLWKERNVVAIERLAKLSVRCMLAVVLPLLLLVFGYSEFIMSLFGPGFEQGGLLLIVMALGQFVNVLSGSVGYLLMMSGHEKDFRRVTLFSGPLTVLLAVLFTAEWGVLGAALSTAIGLSLQNLFAVVVVRRRLGFWPIG